MSGEWLAVPEEAPQGEALRRQNHTGRAGLAEGFAERVDGLLGRVLRPWKRGRKRKRNVEERGSGDGAV